MEYRIPGISAKETIESVDVVSHRKRDDYFYDITMLNGNKEITPCTFDTKKELEETMQLQLSAYVTRENIDYKSIIMPGALTAGGLSIMASLMIAPAFLGTSWELTSMANLDAALFASLGGAAGVGSTGAYAVCLNNLLDISNQKKYKLTHNNYNLLVSDEYTNILLSEYSVRTPDDEARQYGSLLFGLDRIPYKEVKQKVKFLTQHQK